MRIRPLAVLLLLGLTPAVGLPAAPGQPLEGRWLLVEQSYGEGASNLISGGDRIVLELTRQGSAHSGRIVDPGDPSRGWAWPAWEAGGRLLPARELRTSSDAAAGSIHARYRISPSPGDEMELEISEDYRVDAGGDLVGTVKVVFVTPEGTRGSYRLLRRFERLK